MSWIYQWNSWRKIAQYEISIRKYIKVNLQLWALSLLKCKGTLNRIINKFRETIIRVKFL